MGITTLMTFEEFEALPDTAEQIELLEGELIRMPPAERRHMEIVQFLYKLLDEAVEKLRKARRTYGLGKVHIEMGYLLTEEPRSWLQPDVSLTHPDQPGAKYYEGSPLMAFEVVSPEDTAARLNRKVRLFLQHGAAEVWLIYPDTRQAWVHLRDTRAARLEEKSIHSQLLPGIQIPLAKLFTPNERK
jgi:Uma2 family endonuclease